MQVDRVCAKLAHMAELDEAVLGARVREARERAGLKQGELASLVNLDRTAVNKIEGGVRKVTALELSDIARAIGVRMATFFAEPTPALVSHRSASGLEVVDSNIDRLLADLATDVELIQTLAPTELGLDHLDERIAELPWPRPSTMAEAESLASRARRFLGVEGDGPLRDLVELVSAVGLLPFAANLGPDTADAGTILLRTGGVSLINSHNKVGRRRLALAHELGHYLIADDYTIDWRVADQQGGDIEARLDRFARALLLPEAGIRETWVRLVEKYDLREVAVQMGSEYRVDMATLARRLQELGIIGSEEASTVRSVTTTQADIVDFGLIIPSDLEGHSLAVPYQRAVLRAFRDERISRERALELLRGTFEDEDLPDRRARREDELWNFVS